MDLHLVMLWMDLMKMKLMFGVKCVYAEFKEETRGEGDREERKKKFTCQKLKGKKRKQRYKDNNNRVVYKDLF